MHIIFANRYFHPDHSATSQMLSDLAFALAEGGNHISIITSRQLYDTPEIRLPSREIIAGVQVYRVWTSRFGRHNLAGRAIDYLTFYLSAAWMLWRLARRGDIIVAKTDPPMLSVVSAPIARIRRAHLVNWLQDLFPEVLEALDGRRSSPRRAAYKFMRALRNRSLRQAKMNIVIGERMAERLARLDVPPQRIRVIPNWSDGTLVTPRHKTTNRLRQEWDLIGKFVVGYSGNLGRAHEFDTLIDAIARLEQDPDAVSMALGEAGLMAVSHGPIATSTDISSPTVRYCLAVHWRRCAPPTIPGRDRNTRSHFSSFPSLPAPRAPRRKPFGPGCPHRVAEA